MPLHSGHKVNSLCSPAKNKLKTIPVGVIYARSDVAYAALTHFQVRFEDKFVNQ